VKSADFFELQQSDLLDSQSQAEADLHDRPVFLTVAMFLGLIKQMTLFFWRGHTRLAGSRHLGDIVCEGRGRLVQLNNPYK